MLGRFRFALRYQIACLGIGAVAVLGVIYWNGLRIQRDYQRAADISTQLLAATSAIMTGLLKAHQVETQFLLAPEDKLVDRREAVLAGAIKQLDRVEALLETLPESDPLLGKATIRPALNAFAVSFNNVVAAENTLGFTPKDGLRGSLEAVASAAEKAVELPTQGALLAALLRMRDTEKNFLLYDDQAAIQRMQRRAKVFYVTLKAVGLPEDQSATIRDAVAAYEQQFKIYAAARDAFREQKNDLTSSYLRLLPIVETFNAAVRERFARSRDAMIEAQRGTDFAMWLAIIGVSLCTLLLSFWVGRRISDPLSRLADAMKRLSQGDLEADFATAKRSDEIGEISQAFSVFHAKIRENQDLIAEQAAIRLRHEQERRQQLLELADAIERKVGDAASELAYASDAMRDSAAAVASTVEETRWRTTAVVAASEQATANVNTVAGATEELTASLSEIAMQMMNSSNVARRAADDARRTDETIRTLAAAAEQIGDVVGLINTIAGQTNLLALNATIEAARAGEAGRGFAIVASEVKTLAAQTAQATEDIRRQIEAIQSVTGEAVSAIENIGGIVKEMDRIAAVIASVLEQQRMATGEIATNITQAAQGTAEVSTNIAGVNQDADQAAHAAEAALAAATSVARRSAELRDLMRHVIDELRAA